MKPTREELQQAVVDAVRNLIEATGACAIYAPLQGTTPLLYLAIGEPHEIMALLLDEAANDSGMRQ